MNLVRKYLNILANISLITKKKNLLVFSSHETDNPNSRLLYYITCDVIYWAPDKMIAKNLGIDIDTYQNIIRKNMAEIFIDPESGTFDETTYFLKERAANKAIFDLSYHLLKLACNKDVTQ